jgi:hypothetical protein
MLEFEKYIRAKGFRGTKLIPHTYIQNYYSKEFSDKRNDNLKIVEIGIREGADFRMLGDWFVSSSVTGIDVNGVNLASERTVFPDTEYDVPYSHLSNLTAIHGDGYSSKVVNLFEDESIDYLIDDASHMLEDHLKCIKMYHKKIKNGGKIILEDVTFQKVGEEKNTCINKIEECAKENNFEFKLYDFRNLPLPEEEIMLDAVQSCRQRQARDAVTTTTDFSVIVELTKQAGK